MSRTTPISSRNLAVITAGRIPPNPSELLGSNRMRDLIRKLSEHALVIIDSPPLLPVTDAAVLATAADGALLVVTAGKTTFDMLQKANENLTKANARTLGIVLNRVPARGSAAGYYGYQYQGDYAATDRMTDRHVMHRQSDRSPPRAAHRRHRLRRDPRRDPARRAVLAAVWIGVRGALAYGHLREAQSAASASA